MGVGSVYFEGGSGANMAGWCRVGDNTCFAGSNAVGMVGRLSDMAVKS